MKVRVTRDDVAMGDTPVPRELEVPGRRRLRRLLARLRPDVSVSGGGVWLVCVASGAERYGAPATSWVGGYADGAGLRVLRSGERRLRDLATAGTPGAELSVHFHYYGGAPAAEFFAALERGELPDRAALAELGRRRAAAAEERAARERERSSPARLLSAEAVAALTGFGATLSVHADDYARVEVHGGDLGGPPRPFLGPRRPRRTPALASESAPARRRRRAAPGRTGRRAVASDDRPPSGTAP